MRKFRGIAIVIVVMELFFFGVCNFLVLGSLRQDANRQYRVDISRAAIELADQYKDSGDFIFDYRRDEEQSFTSHISSTGNFDIKKYPSLIRVSLFQANEVINNNYEVREVLGKIICFEYEIKPDIRPLLYMDLGMLSCFIFTVIILIYVNQRVLRPFHKMSNLSIELARGNLSVPVKADQNKFFGKFLWGINMLRDNLESNKERELALQKDKKTLILSLSHDIKTPLSAIKLYARALDENLYDTEEKRREAVSGIAHNASQIEKYVADIVTASKEDFLNLEVVINEFYLDEVMSRIDVLYREKFSSLHTSFSMEEYSDVLLFGDSARLEEVLQNILENAIKYGDGRWVKISFSDEEDCRLITVTNSGCSIQEDEVPHLFESFYRGSNADKVNGSGLGLYIARSLMRMMNGDIFAKIGVENKNQENDQTFAVTVVVKKA